MIKKEIGELRRRFTTKRSNASNIMGCYVSEKKEIISTFSLSAAMLGEEELEKYFSLFKSSLSGTVDKNLLDISFATSQVADSPEHKLLMTLRNSALKDEESLKKLYSLIIESFAFDESYVILMIADRFDVFKPSLREESKNDSEEMFSFISCAICPVKETKSALVYESEEKTFHETDTDYILSKPSLGFLFPAFDDRTTNIYNALYYTKSSKDNHPEVAQAVFNVGIPMPSEEQKEVFQEVLASSLEEECTTEVVNSIHSCLSGILEENKENKAEESPKISKIQLSDCLMSCGVSDEKIEHFEENYDSQFGDDAELSPHNVLYTREIVLKTENVTIKINPERKDLFETKIIDGNPCVVIKTEGALTINGVNVKITEKEEATV